MAQEHRLQSQRFELKYLIPPRLIPGVRNFLRCYLELDDFCESWPDKAYPIHSIYLDSPDLKTYAASLNGIKNRFKLRLRYYDDSIESPIFCEIKGRVDNCMTKQRCAIRREAVQLLLDGQLPGNESLLTTEPRHLAALQQFHFLTVQMGARPTAHSCYFREAWVSTSDNSVRVTFDKAVSIEPCSDTFVSTELIKPRRVFDDLTVLELKFTTRFPTWLRELVEHFGLMQTSASKYADGITVSGERLFRGQPGLGIQSETLVE